MFINKIINAIKSRLIDRSTPVQVVASAYDTSGNGGRKLVRLSNGWLVAAEYNSAETRIYFYKSIDNGANWSQLCYTGNYHNGSNFAIASHGTMVYHLDTLLNTGGFPTAKFYKFDATTVPDTSLSGFVILDTQSFFGSGCSLTCDSSGNLYAAWCSKNDTYPNSFNIRHAKSTNGGSTWTKADGTAGVDQITINNGTGVSIANINPSIVIMSNDYPIITYQCVYSGSYSIRCCAWGGSYWNTQLVIYDGSTYIQYAPCAVVASNGTIHVAWHGTDSVDTGEYNIRYVKLMNNGIEWSGIEKLTTGTSYGGRQFPSIACDKNNKIYISFQGRIDNTTLKSNILQITNDGTGWSETRYLTNSTTENILYPSLCANYNDFTDPLCIYQDNQAGAVMFRGVWTEQ